MKRLIIIFLLLGLVLGAQAQSLPSKCKVYQPQILLKSKVLHETDANSLTASSDFGQSTRASEAKYWVVFSDRSSNPTYTSPSSGSSKCSTLSFSEELRIADIQNGYALVYSEPNNAMNYPAISAEAVCKGWVPMSKLLLWTSCIADSKGIYYKALLCNNVDIHSSLVGEGDSNPSTKEGNFPLNAEEFFFIMKREGNMVLLAKQHNLGAGALSRKLYGWVPEESYVPWNQRSCLEPTWEHEDVEYFASQKIEAKIYDKEGNIAIRWPFKKKDEPFEQYQYRMEPDAFRFPIMDGSTSSKYECTSFYSAGKSQSGASSRMTKQKLYLEGKKKIRFLIVMDGTKSMDVFAQSVYDAVKAGCDYFDKNYDIQVGALLYRDYPDGDKITEAYYNYKFTRPNDPNLLTFLQKGGEYGYKSSVNDKTNTEAVFYGINAALDKFKFDTLQSNIMLVIGDCGNIENDTKSPTAEKLAQKLVEKQVELISFQVCNKSSSDWNCFNTQMVTIIKKSLGTKYTAIRKDLNVAVSQSTIGYDFYPAGARGNELYFGTHRYATSGTTISTSALKDLMQKSIKDYHSTIQHKIDLVVNGAPVVNNTTEVKFASTTEAKNSFDIDEAYLKKILGQGGGFVGFRGYTSKQDASERDFFKPVLFISSEEFDGLLTQLKPVAEAARKAQADDRQPYIKAVKALLRAMVPGMTNKEMDEMGLNDVMSMLEGLNAATESTGQYNYTLLQIADKDAVSNAKFLKIIKDFEQKYNTLSHIKDARYKYMKDFNGAKYYWIPIEDLP